MIFGNKICKEVLKIMGIPADQPRTNEEVHMRYYSFVNTPNDLLTDEQNETKKKLIDFVQNYEKRKEEEKKKNDH